MAPRLTTLVQQIRDSFPGLHVTIETSWSSTDRKLGRLHHEGKGRHGNKLIVRQIKGHKFFEWPILFTHSSSERIPRLWGKMGRHPKRSRRDEQTPGRLGSAQERNLMALVPARYGAATLDEIAEALGLSRSMIRNIEAKALKKLREGFEALGIDSDILETQGAFEELPWR